MAERRMFAKTIIDSDLFLDMPLSTQALYFHLSMRADDDGFLNNPKKIQKMVSCSEDDLKLLIAKQFIIPFESGVVVIKHWKIHNYIRNDRYKETVYSNEKTKLFLKSTGEYTTNPSEGKPAKPSRLPVGIPTGIPDDNQTTYRLDTQDRLGKDSIYINNNNINNNTTSQERCGSSDSKSDSPVIAQIILNDKSFFDITQSMLEKWTELYPAINVKQEINKMIGWVDANPTKRKTRAGIKRFINSWLSRAQDRGGSQRVGMNGIVMANVEDHSMDSVF